MMPTMIRAILSLRCTEAGSGVWCLVSGVWCLVYFGNRAPGIGPDSQTPGTRHQTPNQTPGTRHQTPLGRCLRLPPQRSFYRMQRHSLIVFLALLPIALGAQVVRVSGIAWDSLHGLPLKDALVNIAGTSRSAFSDATG